MEKNESVRLSWILLFLLLAIGFGAMVLLGAGGSLTA